MKGNPELSEKWVQRILTENPSLLGFGDIDLKDEERIQPHGGRLDLLLYDPDTSTRYEVELQLGSTDESHIIRTIEYWDTERRRYPQYDHVAVIVAEEITARFFNVISLFNGFIPIVAVQMTAIEVGENEVTLVFNKVLDRMVLGSDEEDEGEPTDRGYWERKASSQMLQFTDRLLKVLVNEVDPEAQLKYNKYYIGLSRNGVGSTYVTFRPRKTKVNMEVKVDRSEELTALIEEADIDSLPYDTRWNAYRPVLSPETSEEQLSVVEQLVRLAHKSYTER